MKDWRQEPATEAQKRRLALEGINFSSPITKGEASDLIGGNLPPEDHQIAVLKFFKIEGISKMSQTDARRAVESILEKSESKERWENRSANKDQKEVYKFFGLKVPPKLKYKDAENFINNLFEDEEKLDAWDKREQEAEEKGALIEENYEMFDLYREYHECKKISKKLFIEVIESLDASGITLEQLESNEDAFFEKVFEINPGLRRVPR